MSVTDDEGVERVRCKHCSGTIESPKGTEVPWVHSKTGMRAEHHPYEHVAEPHDPPRSPLTYPNPKPERPTANGFPPS